MKKIVGFFLVSLTFIFVFCPSVFAVDSTTDKAVTIVNKGNDLIDKRIDQAQASGDNLVCTQANTVALENKANNLQKQTDNIAERIINKASSYGLEVCNEYNDYTIAGQTVSIDPMRVVGP